MLFGDAGSKHLVLPDLFTSNSTARKDPDTWQVAIILTTCILSMLGSLLIMFTWMAFTSIRTPSRGLLVCLSIADFMVALSNAAGLISQYRKTTTFCIVQATVAAFSSVSSFLWTICFAIHIYITILWSSPYWVRHMITIYHLICWLVPVAVAMAANFSNVLGYERSILSAWWCDLRSHLPRRDKLLWIMLLSEAWAWTAYIVIPAIYLRIKLYIRHESMLGDKVLTKSSREVMLTVDRKLTAIPLTFILLHFFPTLRCIFWLHSAYSGGSHKLHRASWLVLLEGIGDSGQGFANSVIFCLWTKKIREQLTSSATRIGRKVMSWCGLLESSENIDRRRSLNSSNHTQTTINSYSEATPLLSPRTLTNQPSKSLHDE